MVFEKGKQMKTFEIAYDVGVIDGKHMLDLEVLEAETITDALDEFNRVRPMCEVHTITTPVQINEPRFYPIHCPSLTIFQ